MARKSGLEGNGMGDNGVSPGQDGFNHPSHVTRYEDNMGKGVRPQVGHGHGDDVDPRGKGAGGFIKD